MIHDVKISTQSGYISLGTTVDGIPNWSYAMFGNPSILYSAHEAY
jgi:hypothetical protein